MFGKKFSKRMERMLSFDLMPQSEKDRIQKKVAVKSAAILAKFKASGDYDRWLDGLRKHFRAKMSHEERRAMIDEAIAKIYADTEAAEEQALQKMDAPAQAIYRREALKKRAAVGDPVAKEIIQLLEGIERTELRIGKIERHEAERRAEHQRAAELAKSGRYRIVDKGDDDIRV